MSRKINREWFENAVNILTEILDYGVVYNAKHQRLAKEDIQKKFLRNKTFKHRVLINCGVYTEKSITCSLPLLEKDRETYRKLINYIERAKEVINDNNRIKDTELRFKYIAEPDRSYQIIVDFDINFGSAGNNTVETVEFQINRGINKDVNETEFINTLKEQIEIIDKKIEWLNEEIEPQQWLDWIHAPGKSGRSVRKINI